MNGLVRGPLLVTGLPLFKSSPDQKKCGHNIGTRYSSENERLKPRSIVGLKGKGSPCSITERIRELIPVLGSQPACDVSHKPGGRLPLLSARPAVTLVTVKRVATNVAARRLRKRKKKLNTGRPNYVYRFLYRKTTEIN